MPSRALPRKNVEGALALCEALDAVFWLLGPAEDDYEETLEDYFDRRTLKCDAGWPKASTCTTRTPPQTSS